ncbi:MAG: VWA domain-containing protein, partial [Myxococcota bacterium]
MARWLGWIGAMGLTACGSPVEDTTDPDPPLRPPAVQDADGDGVPDTNDRCPGFDDTLDADGDAVPDGCDACPGFDDEMDADDDGVPDGCDLCAEGPDSVDADSDGVPDDCDTCPGADDAADADSDGVADGCDACANFDDALDADADGVPDACDICPGATDADDADADGVPDGCDVCPDFDDAIDTDGDGVPGDGTAESCDRCEGFDDTFDTDGDTVADGCDACFASDDLADLDLDGVADGCDACPLGDDSLDADSDGIADACDRCPGEDDTVDVDLDDVPDACDACIGTAESESFALPTLPSGADFDLLLVVDDSGSGQAAQTALSGAASAFVQALGTDDWHVGVITTTSPTFQGPVITAGPQAATELSAQVSVGTGGSAIEAGIDRAYDATLPTGDAGPIGTTGFLRSSAQLVIVFVSEEPDASSGVTPFEALNYWTALKGGDPDQILVHGILSAPPDDAGYSDLITWTSGLQYDIATVQWDAALTTIAGPPLPTVAFALPDAPVPGSLSVTVDGLRTSDWVYQPVTNEVAFLTPPAGTTATIDYVTECDGITTACDDGIDNDGDGAVDFPDEP